MEKGEGRLRALLTWVNWSSFACVTGFWKLSWYTCFLLVLRSDRACGRHVESRGKQFDRSSLGVDGRQPYSCCRASCGGQAVMEVG